MSNNITALQQAIALIEKLKGQVTDLSTGLVEISKAGREVNGNFANIRLPKELEKSLEANKTLIAQFNQNAKERERLEKALEKAIAKRSEAESKVNKEIVKNRHEIQLINKALKDEAVLSSKLSSAYQKLSVKHRQAADTLRNYIAQGRLGNETQRKFNRRINRAQKEFDRLDKKIKKADSAIRDFRRNVGNYTTALGKANLAFRNFAGIFGAYSALQISKEIFDQIKAIDAMNKALKQITDSTIQFNQANLFLEKLADEAGVNILKLSKAYVKFFAAAKNTNLTLIDTQKIFRNVTKAASILGLSTADTEGALRALEQMLSKGKVQAEEIRGQLGERLPGAFQILARSMGLTTQQLDKQLELGNVIASEVLPKFAAELERTYSLDKVDKVETINAAQNRLTNSWLEFVESVENGEGAISKVFTNIFTILSNAIKGFEFLFKSAEQLNKEFNDKVAAESYAKELEILQSVAEETGETMKDVASRSFFDYTKSLERAKEEVETINSSIRTLNKLIDDSKDGEGVVDMQKSLEEERKSLEEANIAVSKREGRLEALNFVLRKTTDEVQTLNKETKKTKKIRLPKLDKIDNGAVGATVDELRKLEKGAKRIEEILEAVKVNITQLNPDGENIKIGIEAVSTVDNQELIDALKRDVDAHKKAQEEKTRYTKLSTEKQHELLGTLFSTFSDYYGLDLSAFSDIIDQKSALEIDYASTVKSINNAILGSTLARYDNEIRANQERLDLVLNDENATEEEKERARRIAEEKENQIRTKQAQAERNATLIQIAIDTAAAIVKATAQTGTLAPFVIPGIIAIGAAQAAFVAAQPLPQFKDGVENFEGGKAVINDQKGSSFREIVETPDGKLSMFKNRNQVVDLPKGTNVYSASDSIDLMKNLNASILMTTFETQESKIDSALMMMSFNASLGKMEKELNLLNKNMDRYSKRPNVVKNHVTIQPPKRTKI
ncbi:tape measure protein [Spongiimicrobium salis]|uniref:tape measure protein n=1 Tax=Spongiimicrobium salis TaxID=1667022 RepID=UPI00374D0428